MFYKELPTEVEVWQGSPRDVFKYIGQPGLEPPKTESVLHFQVKPQETKQLLWLMSLLPDNTIVGSTDEVPGVKGTKMPSKCEANSLKPVEVQTIYSHNVRISSMNDVEAAFGTFLKDWRSFPE